MAYYVDYTLLHGTEHSRRLLAVIFRQLRLDPEAVRRYAREPSHHRFLSDIVIDSAHAP